MGAARCCIAVAIAGALAACGAVDGTARRDPVIFVHGLHGSAAAWTTMAARLADDGWRPADLHAWRYDWRRSNAATALRLRAEVAVVLAESGARRVDVVTHSMGALPSRWFLKELGGTARVGRWVSLGGPDHGIAGRPLCGQASCREMRAGSRFLAALNRGDETPGPTAYATWWSPCDAIVRPAGSTVLRGATNTRTRCLSHGGLLSDPSVYRQVRAFLER